jgi:hypothetical protein
MHKVVMQVNTVNELDSLSETLTQRQIKFKLWTEQPENIHTGIVF